MNRMSKSGCDRELPSELNEPLINPLLIHIVAPFVKENNPSYILQANGEELWKWKEVLLPQTAFDLIQNSIRYLGYQLEASSKDCVGHAMVENIRKFKRKMERIIQMEKKGKLCEQRLG